MRRGEVKRGVSVTEQAPLEGSNEPPSPLVFKLHARSSQADRGCNILSMFTAKHSGVSNPSLFLSFRGFRKNKATFVSGLHPSISF